MSSFQFECVELSLQTPTEYFGRFIFKPLDPGDGITLGNIFRRVLLTNLQGLSIVGVRIAGVNHEFSTIPGVREDVLEILLNLKELIFKGNSSEASFGRLNLQGPAIVTASCLDLPPEIQLINPNQYIATIADNSFLEMEIKLDWGKGYILADNQKVEAPIDFLRVDAIFMPIRRVNYQIKSILSEDLAPKEQLIFEVWTNGSITPHDAIIRATKIITNWFEPIKSLQTTTLDLSNDKESKNVNELPIEELHLSARAYNGLKRAQIDFIGQILKYSLNDLKEIKNFGQKSVQEVIDALQYRYGIILEQTNVT